MKKITYLVAPLMVLPFLVGCGNKTKTHKVTVSEWNSKAIKFTDKKGKEFNEKSKVTHGKDFTFRIEAKQANGDGAKKEVFKEGVFVFIGGSEMPYLGDYDFAYDNTDYTSATVTIPGASITGDIVLAGIEWEEGKYICELPLMAGAKIKSVTYPGGDSSPVPVEIVGGYYAYLPDDKITTITFDADGDVTFPNAVGIALGVNDEYICNIVGSNAEGWTTYNQTTGVLTIDPVGYATAFLGRKPIKNLVLMARGATYPLLNNLDWDTIKLISDLGYAASLFRIGDEKTIKVNDKDHVIRIIGFGEDIIDEEHYVGITFQFKTLVSDSEGNPILTHWSDTDSRYNANYDFINSTLNNKIGEVFDMLPDELKADGMIETVKKRVGIYGDDPSTAPVQNVWYAAEYSTKLFPIAEQEHHGDVSQLSVVPGEASGEYFYYYTLEQEGTIYDGRSLKAANGEGYGYWTRSPRMGSQGGAAFAVSSAGYVDEDGQWCRAHEYALAPCFCI